MALLNSVRLPPAAWHAQRDEIVALACELGLLAGSLGKIAKDVSLMAQGEVGEVAEPSDGGRGGSSAMPHKRNPVASMIALSAALRAPAHVAALLAAMPQEHERGLGNWQAELAESGALLACVHGAIAALAQAGAGLQVDPGRMRRNIDALQGLVFAEGLSMCLARTIGKSEAHHWVGGVVATTRRSTRGRTCATSRSPALGEDDERLRDRDRLRRSTRRAVRRPGAGAPGRVALARPQLRRAGPAQSRLQSKSLRGGAPWQPWLPTACEDIRMTA